ncbi:DUF1949 domain-containing protein [Oerskovia sp. M15]
MHEWCGTHGGALEGADYAAAATFRLLVPPARLAPLEADLAAASSGTLSPSRAIAGSSTSPPDQPPGLEGRGRSPPAGAVGNEQPVRRRGPPLRGVSGLVSPVPGRPTAALAPCGRAGTRPSHPRSPGRRPRSGRECPGGTRRASCHSARSAGRPSLTRKGDAGRAQVRLDQRVQPGD